MRRIILGLILATAMSAGAQVPAGATPVTLTQVNTLAGLTTWTFTAAGQTYYLQAPAYVSLFIPGGPGSLTTIAAPELWVMAATPVASPDGTVILNNSGTAITDASGGKWTVVNGEVMFNGAAIGYSSGVTELAIKAGILWQENTASNWYYWNVTSKEWDGGADPL